MKEKLKEKINNIISESVMEEDFAWGQQRAKEEIELFFDGLAVESLDVWKWLNNRFNSMIKIAEREIYVTPLELKALKSQVLSDYASLLKKIGIKEEQLGANKDE